MENVNIKINGIDVCAPAGSTILDAAHIAGIKIPTLCFLKEINEIGACRMCIVEVKGARNLVAACVHPINEGMEVLTNTPELIASRKRTLELILSNHDKKCLSCVRSGKCELQELCQELGVEDENYFAGESPEFELDDSAPHMIRDNNKCILCRRCTAVCEKVQSVGVIGPNNRGFASFIGSPFDMGLAETSCVSCGQCITACPTGALYEKDFIDDVLAAIADESKHVIVQPAPSVRAALGEEFGYPMGTDVEGKMAAALRRIGFDGVFDTDFSADLTIMEEAHEFLDRVQNGGVLPMMTSCSPGWIKYCEHYYPDQLEHLSSCKSPQQMFGAIAKTYYAEKMGIDPKNIVCVSVMPCTAKKFEINRDDQDAAGVPDVDISITTRELARLIRKVGINFRSLPDEGFDDPLGESTGAGVIFGATGGVMEAALRTAVETLTGEELASLDFNEVRGTEGIKEATYNVAGMDVKVAVASGLSNAKQIMDKVRAGEADYHFIEIMCCPGGCVNGGGQPQVHADVRNYEDVRAIRAKALYDNDKAKTIRKSHDNPSIKKLYEEFLGEPGSEKAHHILHTSYVKRSIN
ncbi:4Fe-4S dicluster domain-containing protein [Eubacterium sp. am_0171]|uniref:NADH-dependent [FeFe] hydrogenase, group A6 n=1 Tax=unclassified Eubacterium (in: firmicutes) TaxID=2624479 RepID=UPI00102267CC|nr:MULTISPECIES: NADH-dependent [FeFe] hydrogenase, group A6 [unclassified Eubacterium (in: firmicutes)]MSC86477.1 2Fe-2S iron-sulfur cluster binding domain-containing protein [Eubacterium sp. BIOML-A1]MSD08534.1 2Fe-2S iron-sulfur cluster binding domain-containing protein [Eubacterium sp. BIOML-A2]RYT12022.1 4Fe-4S dicluster domain-containing protein [Eubacterium sp. am_0171]